jgi:hypothetical protein
MWVRESKMCAKHEQLLVGIIFLAVMSLGCEGQCLELDDADHRLPGIRRQFQPLRIG